MAQLGSHEAYKQAYAAWERETDPRKKEVLRVKLNEARTAYAESGLYSGSRMGPKG